MKYLIVDYKNGLSKVPILFSDVINFYEMVNDNYEILSAGFVKIDSEGYVRCYGRSCYLKTPNQNHCEDAKIISQFIVGNRP